MFLRHVGCLGKIREHAISTRNYKSLKMYVCVIKKKNMCVLKNTQFPSDEKVEKSRRATF